MYLISGLFTLLLEVLFNFHSHYLFAIGFEEYLELEVYRSHIQIHISIYPTLEFKNL